MDIRRTSSFYLLRHPTECFPIQNNYPRRLSTYVNNTIIANILELPSEATTHFYMYPQMCQILDHKGKFDT